MNFQPLSGCQSKSFLLRLGRSGGASASPPDAGRTERSRVIPQRDGEKSCGEKERSTQLEGNRQERERGQGREESEEWQSFHDGEMSELP